jgi:hypothetical protein
VRFRSLGESARKSHGEGQQDGGDGGRSMRIFWIKWGNLWSHGIYEIRIFFSWIPSGYD